MDRLVCGDVGFGKTEVALRSAFVAAMNGKQVAVVVPTTLLSRQHFATFQARFKGLPLNIAQASRLVPRKDLEKTREGLASGDVDIVVGTHAVLAESIMPYHVERFEYKPAADIDTAVKQFEAVGFPVQRFKKPGEPGPHPEKKGAMSDGSLLKLLNVIGPEAARLRNEWPGMFNDRCVFLQSRPKAIAAGAYDYNAHTMHLQSTSSFHSTSGPQTPGGIPFGVHGDKASSAEEVTKSVFRHEFGHHFDYSVTKEAMKDEIAGMLGGKPAMKAWGKANISQYAGTHRSECVAEMMALITAPDYKPGRIPEEVESVLHKYLKQANEGAVNKRAGADYEDGDLSATPIEPNDPRWMLHSTDGYLIRYVGPGGEILTAEEMASRGLIDAPEDDEDE